MSGSEKEIVVSIAHDNNPYTDLPSFYMETLERINSIRKSNRMLQFMMWNLDMMAQVRGMPNIDIPSKNLDLELDDWLSDLLL